MFKIISTAAVVGASILVAAPAHAQYYESKTIDLLIPVPGGSGLDLVARVFADHLSKNIPGNPTIVPRNMPGGGGLISLNYLYDRAEPDGLTINFGPWQAPAVIAGDPGANFVPEEFGFAGAGFQPTTTIMLTSPDLEIPEDIVNVARFKLAGSSPTGSLDLPGNLALDIIGADYDFIPGYSGMAQQRPALMGGEVQAVHSGFVGYNQFFKDTMIAEGEAIALWHHTNFDLEGNPVADPAASEEMPAFHEVYRKIHGELPSGPKWDAYRWYRTVVAQMQFTLFAPDGTPQEALEELRTGYYALAESPEFQEDFIALNGAPMTPMPLEQGLEIINTYRDVSSEILSTLEEMGAKGL